MSSDPSWTRPLVTRRMPTRLFNSVLFPAPFGPITATTSPRPTAMDTSCTTGAPPYPDVMLCAARSGVGRTAVAAGAILPNKVSINDLPLPAEGRQRPAPNDLALRHYDHRIAEPLHHVELVLDHDD